MFEQKMDASGVHLRAHMAEEFWGGFPKLSRIPRQQHAHIAGLSRHTGEAGRDSLLDTLAVLAAKRFFPPPAVRDRMAELVNHDPAYLLAFPSYCYRVERTGQCRRLGECAPESTCRGRNRGK